MFGLSVAQNADICVRCELRLILAFGRIQHTGYQRNNRLQRRPLSIQPELYREQLQHAEGSHDQEHTTPNATVKSKSRAVTDIDLPEDAHATFNVQTNPRRPGNTQWRGLTLYTSRALGVDALGKPAEALLLHPSNEPQITHSTYTNSFDDRLNSHQSVSPAELVSNIASERGIVNLGRTKQNIEEVRLSWLSELEDPASGPSNQNCDELKKRLCDGFTLRQLLEYRNAHRDTGPAGPIALFRPYESDLFTRTQWISGETAFSKVAATRMAAIKRTNAWHDSNLDPQFDSMKNTNSHKDTVAASIVQHCWQIYAPAELEPEGEIDILVAPEHLQLIISHRKDMLRRISEEYGAKIRCSQSRSIMRISGNYWTCEATLKLLILVLQEITCTSIGIERTGSKDEASAIDHQARLNDTLLQQIDKLTNTIVRWSNLDKAGLLQRNLLVYHMKHDTQNLDDARKLIFDTLKPAIPKATKCLLGQQKGTYVPIPVETGSGLPLSERGTQWARLSADTMPKRQMYQRDAIEKNPIPKEALATAAKYLNKILPVQKTSVKVQYWGSTRTRDDALFLGRLLYPLNSPLFASPKGSEFLNSRHVLQTDIARLVKMLWHLNSKLESIERLRIRMNPIHGIGSQNRSRADALPDLQLNFMINLEKQKVILEDIRLIVEDREADLLLPEFPMDMRFNAQCYVKAQEDIDPAIHKFIEASNLNIWGAQRLKTPSNLTLSIPVHAISLESSYRRTGKTYIDVEFAFASIEHMVSLTRPVQGDIPFQISYTTVEGGHAGGRRNEVCLSRTASASAKMASDAQRSKDSGVASMYAHAVELMESLDRRQDFASTTEPMKVRKVSTDVKEMNNLERNRTLKIATDGLVRKYDKLVRKVKFDQQPLAKRSGGPEKENSSSVHTNDQSNIDLEV